MLGKLLHALKSEKSSKGAHNATQSKQQQPQSGTAATPLAALSLFQIDPSVASHQQVIVAESLPKIRYFVLESLPELYLQVLACPLSVFHSLPHSQRQVKQISLLELPMPEYLCFLHPLLAQQLPSHNHLLINHYPPGIGIMPHRDGPAYLPKVLVLSLHSHAVISFQPTTSGSPCLRLLLQPNSIHIFQHQAYTTHMHGIDNYQIDSVLLSYDPVQDRVTDCNVGNYKQLACRGWLEACMRAGEAEVEQGDLRLLRLQGNAEYTHKLEVRRRERVSVTIRHKYP